MQPLQEMLSVLRFLRLMLQLAADGRQVDMDVGKRTVTFRQALSPLPYTQDPRSL